MCSVLKMADEFGMEHNVGREERRWTRKNKSRGVCEIHMCGMATCMKFEGETNGKMACGSM
jgi:hypothetical protein